MTGFILEARRWGDDLAPPLLLEVDAGRLRRVESAAAGGRPGGSPGGGARLADPYRVSAGFVDAHTHLVGLGLEFLRPNFAGAASREEVLARLDAWLQAHPGSEPVVGEGWDQSLWADPRPPERDEIDAVAPDRPVALRRVCGHVAVFNSAALALLGTDWEGLDAGSGLALERLPLTIGRHWPPGREMMDEAVRLGQEEAWRHGVTGVHEMGHPGTFRAFARAAVEGRLRLRVTHFFGIEHREAIDQAGLVPGFGESCLRVGGIKFFLDGSIGGRSAAVRAPYPGAPPSGGGFGQLLWTDEALADALRTVFSGGYQAALHAIGDAAIEQAIRVVTRLGASGLRAPAPGPRLEHAEMLDPQLLARGVEAGFLFCMQPNFTARWQGQGQLYEQVLGPERALSLNPYAAVARTGRLLFGSDTMPLSPLGGLAGAVNHPDPAQRLDFGEAISAYTEAAAAGVSHPYGRSRLAAGEPADFCVLRRRIPENGDGAAGGPPSGRSGDGPREWEVAGTWCGGVRVHADSRLEADLASAGG